MKYKDAILKKAFKFFITFILISLISNLPLLISQSFAIAQTKDDLQAKIDQKNKDIQALHTEIDSLGKQIDDLGSQASSLSNTIKSLGLTRKKLEANISLTQDKISAKNYEIQKLGTQITGKESSIEDNKRIISKTFSSIQEQGNQSLIELMLSNGSLSSKWNSMEQLSVLQNNLFTHIKDLNKDKMDLESNKNASEKAKMELVALNKDLSDQRAIVLSTTAEQNALLKQTNQSEASYKKMLAAKKTQEAAFQAEIDNYESQLNLLVNPALIPHTGSGVLAWPLDKVTITQYFGNTTFSTANPQIYNGKGHTGVDFRASIGTPVKSAGEGIVVGSGNTDLYKGCYSYGQWIMIKHPNGLSTLYGHLSLRNVTVGEEVSTGEMIGYSGNTGYSTGPHLHFGVYATQGVQIKKFDTSVNCKGATIPIADYKAYLNPLSYL